MLKSLAVVLQQKRQEEANFINLSSSPKPLKEEGIPEDLTTLELSESLYKQALDSIPKKDRDDGIFGLNWKRETIGGRPYSVIGNTLFVEKDDGMKKAFNIDDINITEEHSMRSRSKHT